MTVAAILGNELRAGTRVRLAEFGLGTVIGFEGDITRVRLKNGKVVRFKPLALNLYVKWTNTLSKHRVLEMKETAQKEQRPQVCSYDPSSYFGTRDCLLPRPNTPLWNRR